MAFIDELKARSGNNCELCNREETLQPYEVPPQERSTTDNTIMICEKCLTQIEKKEPLDSKHWKVLQETMWSEVPGVKVMAWRMLSRMRDESWATDNLDMIYLDDEQLSWAKATGDHENDSTVVMHKDAYGHLLQTGDTVVLTKHLDVKGTSLTAKLGTVVKNIRLVHDNTEQIEGKVEGQTIVILTKFVKKQG
jgi:protein PhnA